MKFLVILTCIIVNYLWLKDFDRFDDAWFFKFRAKVIAKLSSTDLDESSRNAFAGLILYGLPGLTLALVLYLLAGVAADLLTLLVHCLVLLVAFDRTQPGQIAKDFLALWREGDIQGSHRYLQENLGLPDSLPAEDEAGLLEYFSQQFVYRCFEKMFVMFFWYLLAGPLAVLFCYVSYQIRDCERLEGKAQEQTPLLNQLLVIIEWIPLRLLGLTFALVGNFVQCFERVKESVSNNSNESAAETLRSYTRCALSGAIPQPEGSSGEEEALYFERTVRETQALQGLLERSQYIWLLVIAAVAILSALRFD